MENNIQEQEKIITATLLECANEIIKLEKQNILKLNESIKDFKLYRFNFRQLLNSIEPLFESVQEIPKISPVKISRNNYYAYFKNVEDYIDNYSPIILQTLNESLIVDDIKTSNATQLNIDTFQTKLVDIIKQLEKIDEVSNYSVDILKIKTFAKKPMFVYGYDILTNLVLKKELSENFGLQEDKLLSICFDKTEKQLLFIGNDFSKIIVYNIKQNILDFYNKINDEKLPQKEIIPQTYLISLKELIHNNIVEIYFNIGILNIKFTDNLYNDNARFNSIALMKQQSKTIKD